MSKQTLYILQVIKHCFKKRNRVDNFSPFSGRRIMLVKTPRAIPRKKVNVRVRIRIHDTYRLHYRNKYQLFNHSCW